MLISDVHNQGVWQNTTLAVGEKGEIMYLSGRLELAAVTNCPESQCLYALILFSSYASYPGCCTLATLLSAHLHSKIQTLREVPPVPQRMGEKRAKRIAVTKT